MKIGVVLCVEVSFAQAEDCAGLVKGYLQAKASMAAQEPVKNQTAATLASVEIARVQALQDRYDDCPVRDQIPQLKASKASTNRPVAITAESN